MPRSFLIVTILVILLGAPAVMACESCIPKGAKDPNGGGPYGSAICWTSNSGQLTYCWGGDTVCQGGSVNNSCPTGGRCSDDGSGGQVCIYDPEPIQSTPVAACRRTDVQGRCAAGVRHAEILVH